MDSNLPFALIIGIEHFAAKKLAQELINKDINVVGVGEYVMDLGSFDNFEWLMDLSEVEGKFNYVFDFKGDTNLWKLDQFKGEKVTMVCVNDKEKADFLKIKADELTLNWRMVEAYGVYGPGMNEDGFLAEAIKLAVVNKNLILPNLKSKFRILAVEDLVEAILRASFLSGTENEKFLVLGNETDSEEIAKVLIDEAKMTRYKVNQKDIKIDEIDKKRFNESLKKLRWEPKIDFKQGVVETLQYFFSKTDDENRKKKKGPVRMAVVEEKEIVKEEPKEIKRTVRKKEFEVMIEEDVPFIPIVPVEAQSNEEIENFYKQEKTLKEEINFSAPTEVEDISFDQDKSGQFNEVLSEDIEEVFDQSFEEEAEEIVKVEEKEIVKKVKTKKFNWKLLLLFLIIFMVLVVPINWTISTVLAVRNIKENLTLIESKKYKEAELLINENLSRVKKIDQQIDDWGLNKMKLFRNYQTLLKIGEDGFKLEKEAINLSQGADLISQAIFKERQINFIDELKKENDNLIVFDNNLGIILARLNDDYSWLPLKWKLYLQKEVQLLRVVKEQINSITKGMNLLPEMLGLDGIKREYLVLLQNETELRATGGFIGSYAILSFQSGRLLNFEVKDVYEADGQSKGHVEPPIEIKNYLGEANWFMRDANWNPNFTKASGDIQWFLNKEIGKKVDGVIGINLAVAKSILGVVGEIYIPNFNTKINRDNLYQEAEYYSENKFFPGSTQKASFLGTVGNQLFEEIRELKVKQQLNLVVSLIDLLEKNEIQLTFNNKETSKIVADLGWNGSIYQGQCAKENCFSDYLFMVESNFGVNKANYFLNRNIEQLIDISQNSIGRVLKVNYENTAKNTNFPGGDYKNYMRIYLPTDVNLSQISLIDGNNSNIEKIYMSDELTIREVDGKKEVGFLVTIPVATKKILEIRYSSENKMTSGDKFSYLNYIQKQSGFGDTGMVILISFPKDWQPIQVEPQASVVGGRLLFNQKLDKDIKMGVELGK